MDYITKISELLIDFENRDIKFKKMEEIIKSVDIILHANLRSLRRSDEVNKALNFLYDYFGEEPDVELLDEYRFELLQNIFENIRINRRIETNKDLAEEGENTENFPR